MARKRKKRSKHRPNLRNTQAASDPTFNSFSMGPISLTRSGNQLLLRSTMTQDEFEDLHAGLRAERPQLQERINRSIDHILELLSSHDPLSLIGPVTFAIEVIGDGREDVEHNRTYADVEYLHSLAAAQEWPNDAPEAEPSTIREMFDTLDQLNQDLLWFYVSEAALDRDPRATLEVRYRLITNSLRVRGEGYWPIMTSIWSGLFASQSDFLMGHYGFDFSDLLRFVESCRTSLSKRATEAMDSVRRAFEVLFETWEGWSTTESGTRSRKSTKSSWGAFIQEHRESASRAFDRFQGFPYADLLRLVVKDDDLPLAKSLALDFGENHAFLETPGWRGWPLNPSLVRKKPLLRRADQFYAPDPAGFGYSLRRITEGLIESADPSYYQTKYLPARDRFLESSVTECLAQLFGAEHVFPNLRYTVLEDGETKNCELDALVMFGDAVLLVEAKAGALSPEARRGAPSLVEDFKDLVGAAYKQQRRARDHITSADRTSFYDEKGREVLQIRRHNAHHILLVTVTLDDLASVAPNLPLLEPLGILDIEAWPWVVSLPDLLTIVEVIESPYLFLHYLHQRLRLNTIPGIASADELDYFMHYLDRALWLPALASDGAAQHYVVGVFTQELDQYYRGRELGGSPAKPRVNIPARLRFLVDHLPASSHKRSVSATFALLDTDGDARRQIEEQIIRCDRETLNDGQPHNLASGFLEARLALLIVGDVNLWVRGKAEHWARKWLAKDDIDTACVVAWLAPLENGVVDCWVFENSHDTLSTEHQGQASHQGKTRGG